MNTKRGLVYAFAVCAAVLTTVVFRLRSQPSGFPTHSITYHSSYADRNGTVGYMPDHFLGQRADGSTVTYTNSKSHPGITAVAVNFYSQGIGVAKNNKTNIVNIDGNGVPIQIPMPDATCSAFSQGDTPIGAGQSILGFATVGFSADNPTMSEERWVAPDLGCATLKRLDSWKDNGVYNGAWTLEEAAEASKTPPDASLFALPEGFVDSTPTDYDATLHDGDRNWFQHHDADGRIANSYALHDARYAENKAKRQAAGTYLPK